MVGLSRAEQPVGSDSSRRSRRRSGSLSDRLRYVVMWSALGGAGAAVMPRLVSVVAGFFMGTDVGAGGVVGVHPLWAVAGVAGVMLAGVVVVTQRVVVPMEDLLHRVEAAAREGERHALERVRRIAEGGGAAEVTRLAAAVHRLGEDALHARHEAERARREAQGKVDTAVRRATGLLQVMADQDPLTGLLNRRAFSARLGEVFDDAGRTGEALAVVRLDVRGLEAVNEQRGRAEGDRLLRAAAEVVAGASGGRRSVGRLDGAGLCLLLSGGTAARARSRASEVAGLVEGRLRVEAGRGRWARPLGVRVGVASMGELGVEDAPSLLEAAERAVGAAGGGGGGEAGQPMVA